MMGGNIKVKSELGKGSEITIGLRFKTTSATKNRGVIQELNGFRALVADDITDSLPLNAKEHALDKCM